MADIKINDLLSASVTSSMQLETDIGGTQSNKISISALTSYLAGVLPLSGLTWNAINLNTNILVSNGYIVNSLSQVILTLPTTASIGQSFKIVNSNSGGFRINQNSGQTILFGTQATTTGVSGYCTSTALGDAIEVICESANTNFRIINAVGNIDLL